MNHTADQQTPSLTLPRNTGRGNQRPSVIRTVLAAVSLAVAGCTVGPDYKKPAPNAPDGWADPLGSSYPTTRPMSFAGDPVHLADWWTRFNDPTLDSLVRRAIAANLDIRRATSAVRQARYVRAQTASELFPRVDGSGGGRRFGSAGEGPQSTFQAGLDAAWEIDVFGGTRRSVEAADALLQASVEDRRDVLISVVSEVAINYVNLRGTQRQLEIAKGNLALQKKNLDLVRRRFNNGNGFAGSLDVSNAEASVAGTSAAIPTLETNARQTAYALSVLLDRAPADLLPELTQSGALPVAPTDVPLGLPSDLLLRRPDVRRAEAELHAATANIGVATADLFPRFSLTGSYGYANGRALSLFNYAGSAWSVGGGLTFPLFDAGRIFNNIKVQNERQEQALVVYRQSVLTALQDTESALVAYVKEYERRAALADAVTANQQAVKSATFLFSNGEVDFLNVISAQQALFGSENALVQSDRTTVTNLIALYKALGGGWESEMEKPQ